MTLGRYQAKLTFEKSQSACARGWHSNRWSQQGTEWSPANTSCQHQLASALKTDWSSYSRRLVTTYSSSPLLALASSSGCLQPCLYNYHVACALRGPTHPFASSCRSFAGGCCCVAVYGMTGGALLMWLVFPGGHRPYSPVIAGQLLVSSAVLLCTAGLGTHSSCDMLPSGPPPALASHGWSVAR